MRRMILGTVAVAIAIAIAPRALGADVKVESDTDKTLYALGLILSQRISSFHLTEAELEVVKMGLSDGALGRPKKVEIETWGPKVNELAQERAKKTAEANKAAGKAFIDKLEADDKSVKKTASGLRYKILTEGTGASPSPTSSVTVNYRGSLIDGTEVDSSYKNNQPSTFTLNQVIACWTEGLQLLKPGAKAKLYCPSDIAYGDAGRPPRTPPGATLIFEVELLEVK